MTSFPWTLQRYLFREMSKTLLLSAVALTGILGLGGGVFNMVKMGEITPGQLLRLGAILLPLAAALTLPMAVLFSATSTYGRFSADNEFVACRASGINLHVLFLPAAVLSLAAAIVSFALTNFLIPGMVHNLTSFVGADIGSLIQHRLNRPRGITLGGNFRIYADGCAADPDDPNRIVLEGVAFVEIDEGEWVRFGTARSVLLEFERKETTLQVGGRMTGLSFYDRKLGHFLEEAEQIIPANELKSPVPQKIKFLTLAELFHYLSEPTTWADVREKMRRLRSAAGRWLAYQAMWEDWLDGRSLTLADEQSRYTIRSQKGSLDPAGGGIDLFDVEIDELRAGRRRVIEAARASIEVTRGASLTESRIQLKLFDVRFGVGESVPLRAKASLTPVVVPPDLVARVQALSDAELLQPPDSPEDDPLAERRRAAVEERAETVRRIVGAIHERMAFSVSILVLVILGAALGIIFRGAHVMTAFGISFVPMLVVIVTIVTGKQMAHNAGTDTLGILVIWSGIAAVAALDGWILTRALRR